MWNKNYRSRKFIAPAIALAILIIVLMLIMPGKMEIRGANSGNMTPFLMMVMALANALIAISYASIPFFLIVFVRKRKDMPFTWVIFLFGLFILACGTTHLVHVVGLWWPVNWWQATVDSICAIISLATAVAVWPILPKILSIPSPNQLRMVNSELQKERDKLIYTQHELQKAYIEIEERVNDRTQELLVANKALLTEINERKKMEEALRTSEVYFRNVFDHSTVGKSITEIGGSIQTNKAYRQILGYSEAELSTLKWQEITHPDDLQRDQEYLDSLLSGKYSSMRWEKRYIHKDGHVIWTDISTVLQRDENNIPLYFITSIQDITERKQAENNILIKDRLLQLTGKTAKVGGWELDTETFQLIWTEEVYRIHEVDSTFNPNVNKGINFYSTLSKPIIEQAIQRAIEFGEPFDLELEFITAKGFNRWVHSIGNIYKENEIIKRVYGSIQDITERKQVAEALKNSNDKILSLADNIPGFMSYVNAETLIYEFVNENYAKSFGILREKIIGSHIKDVISEPNYQFALKSINEVKQGKSVSYENSFNLVTGKHWIQVNYTPVFNDKGHVTSIVVLSYDITERKRVEEALRESEERYRSLLTNLEAGIVVHAPDTSIVMNNHRASELLGLSDDQLKGKLALDPQWKFIYDNDTSVPLEEYPVNRIIATKKPIRDLIFGVVRPKTNDIARLTVNGFPVFNNNGELSEILVSFIEITERIKAEETLKESERNKTELLDKLNDAQHMAMIGSWEWDLKSNLVWWSDETYEIFGVTKQNFTPNFEANGEFIHPDDFEQYGKAFEHSFQTGEPLNCEFKLIAGNGQLKYCQAKGKLIYDEFHQPIRFIGTIMDITQRKLAEYTLLETEAKFRQTFELSPVGIVMAGLNKRFIHCNNAFANSLGYKTDELVGKPLADVTYPEDSQLGMEEMMAILKSEIDISHVQKRYVRKDGHIVWCEVTISIIRDSEEQPQYFLAIIQDITKKRESENQLNLTSRILAVLNEPKDLSEIIPRILTEIKQSLDFEAIGFRLKNGDDFPYFVQEGFPNDFIVNENSLLERDSKGSVCRDENGDINLECTCGLIVSGKTDPQNPYFTRGGSAWTNNTVTSLSIPVPKDTRLHPRDRCIHEGYQSVALIPVRVNTETFGILQLNDKRKDKLTLELVQFLEGISSFIGMALIRKKQTEALRFKNLVFDASLVANSIADINGNYTEINDTFLRIWGYSNRDEVLGLPIQSFFNNQNNALDIISSLNNIGQWEGDFTAKRKDGSTFFAHGLATTVKNDYGNQIGYQSAIIDITERKQAEDEIIKLNETLEQRVIQRTEQLEVANKELEAFSYSVSHDLRAPLRHINGFVDILTKDVKDKLSEKDLHYLDVINNSAKKMGTLIDDLLSFSRTGRAEIRKSKINMNQVIDEAISQIKPATVGRKIKWDISPLAEVSGDYNLMRLVWVNLIDNAVKYTKTKEKAIIKINCTEEKEEFIFRICDNGVGFDMNYAQKLFGVFQRLHSSAEFEGTGIGLANVRRIILRHGGRIWAEAVLDKGATFYFTMPKESAEEKIIGDSI